MELKKISANHRKLIHYAIGLLMTDVYFERYFDILHELGSGRNNPTLAFQQLENELQALTGQARYTDYNSFREMRRRYTIRISRRGKKTKSS